MKRARTKGPLHWTGGLTAGPAHQALRIIARRAAERLFETLDLRVVHAGSFSPHEERWTAPVAILPFTGSQVAGSLLVASPFELMAGRAIADFDDVEALVDWSCELANLLMGSLKTALLQQGVILELGVPTSVLGNDVRIASLTADATGMLFRRGDHVIHVALDAYCAPEVTLHGEAARETAFDVLFF